MPAPENKLKAALARRELQIGIWLGLCSPAVAEMAVAAGYDWCIIDGEHGPNDLPLMAEQLLALEGRGASAVVRVPQGEDWILKQVLDIGAQSVLVPMVETAEQARRVVEACKYAPEGRRGGAMPWRWPVAIMPFQITPKQPMIKFALWYRSKRAPRWPILPKSPKCRALIASLSARQI